MGHHLRSAARTTLVLIPIVFASLAHAAPPVYSGSSVVNAATGLSGAIAPGEIATIYGSGLSYSERFLTSDQITNGFLPTSLIGADATVFVAHQLAPLFYVGPTQINFLVPDNLVGTRVEVQVTRDGIAGPPVQVALAPVAPAFFTQPGSMVSAIHADGSPITHDQPARPGEVIVLFANGLGVTTPPLLVGEITRRATPIQSTDVTLTVNGVPVPRASLLYIGLTPGAAGLYQINLLLPPTTPPDPEIRLTLNGIVTPPGLELPVAQ